MTIEPGEEMDSLGLPDDIGLWGECGEFAMPGSLWRALLMLAQRYGWEPAGTLPPVEDCAEFLESLPEEPGWEQAGAVANELDRGGRDGSYDPPCSQVMTSEDAQSFGRALERLLLDIPHGVESPGALFVDWAKASSSIIRIVDAVFIEDERLGEGADFQEPMPVRRIAR